MNALRAQHAGGRRVFRPPNPDPGPHLVQSSTAPRRDVLSNDALPPPALVDGVIGACARKRRSLTSRNPAPRGPDHSTERSGPLRFPTVSSTHLEERSMSYQPDTLAIHAGQ